MATATDSYVAASIWVTPSRDAMTSNGTVSAHGVDRAGPPEVTEMNVPRALWATCCSGDPGALTTIRSQPRRAASLASASTSAVCPERDTAITRSAAPTQPGS